VTTGHYIGTSGWYYDHWVGNFYPPGLNRREWLPHYCREFATVELNSTFYHLPNHKSVEHWREVAPEGFRFAVKANRGITHYHQLQGVEQEIARLLHLIKPLGERLGPILFQLPPDLERDPGRLRELFALHPRGYRYAIEFRHPSWLDEGVFQLLADHGIALCLNDYGRTATPRITTAEHVYIRLHGPSGHYSGDYSLEALQGWAQEIERFQAEGREVWCYFNNDDQGLAVKNARELRGYLESGGTAG